MLETVAEDFSRPLVRLGPWNGAGGFRDRKVLREVPERARKRAGLRQFERLVSVPRDRNRTCGTRPMS
jgi:hypothetical protein